MAYRKRRRPERDPTTGITYVRQLSKVPNEYLFMLEDEAPLGAFDLTSWAEENDQTCDLISGGLSNVRSMAAVGGVTESTLVNSVFPRIAHCLHHEGPVVISSVNTIVAACRDYTSEQRAKQREAGLQNAGNLIRWEMKTDPSSASLPNNPTSFTVTG